MRFGSCSTATSAAASRAWLLQVLLASACGAADHHRLATQLTEAQSRLDANHALEGAQVAVAGDGSEAAARLERKYALLGQALAVGAERGVALPVAYNPKELAAVKDVFATYGDLYVGPTAGEEVKLATTPWAGYWYPMSRSDLYAGESSPLAKLDRLAQALGQPGNTVAWEQAHHVIPADSWEGFCSAWAVAAVTSREPTRSLSYRGVTFTPADQKALLTKAHELYPTRQFGIRYDGTADTDGTFQDLRPEGFHRLVEAVMRDRALPFVLDTDPGVEVWTKPLDRYRWIIKADPEQPDAFRVTGLPWFVRQREAEVDTPTKDEDLLTDVYEYRLYVDKATQQNGKYLVIAGEWLGNSLNNHPDYVLVPAIDGAWGSANAALQQALGVVHELFAKGMPDQ